MHTSRVRCPRFIEFLGNPVISMSKNLHGMLEFNLFQISPNIIYRRGKEKQLTVHGFGKQFSQTAMRTTGKLKTGRNDYPEIG